MSAIKSSILKRMDKEPPGVRVCCIKFIQRVVQVQTPGQVADPRVRDSILPYIFSTAVDSMIASGPK